MREGCDAATKPSGVTEIMVFVFKKSYLRANLIFGLIWLTVFILKVFIEDNTNSISYWIDYGFLLVAVLYLGTYLYQKRYGYLTLENGLLKLNDPRNKHIDLNTVTRFKFFAGEYILESDSKKLKVNTYLLEPPSVALLKAALEKHGLKPGTSRILQMESN
ncbi:hypothetical protein [Lentiprolixibacter aurantiacus]|uniref:Uncharacterized protein n=1 Tax=Lentiprolixibacter aurantiacus TaxID=2993939 RepID=A0AAE3SPI8_9FLAO|nr:hypothetical protein [Lentiprolixibacter aurantiacus]MCX2720271.1 hypothetical protein [Lentiprolixibacter aurantiacus]